MGSEAWVQQDTPTPIEWPQVRTYILRRTKDQDERIESLEAQLTAANARIVRLRAALIAAKAVIKGCKELGPDDGLSYTYANAMLDVDTHHDLKEPDRA